jgi:hypothetical protein
MYGTCPDTVRNVGPFQRADFLAPLPRQQQQLGNVTKDTGIIRRTPDDAQFVVGKDAGSLP